MVLNLPVLSLFLFCFKYASPYLFLYFHLDSNAVRWRGESNEHLFTKAEADLRPLAGNFKSRREKVQIAGGKKKWNKIKISAGNLNSFKVRYLEPLEVWRWFLKDLIIFAKCDPRRPKIACICNSLQNNQRSEEGKSLLVSV